MAVAQVLITRASDCVKPWAIPDKWDDNRLPSGQPSTGWDWTSTYDRYSDTGNARGQLLPTPADLDFYTPPGPDGVPPGTGFRPGGIGGKAGVPETFTAGHWHSDTLIPPDGAPIVAVSQACLRQGFALDRGRVVGLQFHLEWTENTLLRMVEACPEDLQPGHPFVQSGERILGHPELHAENRALLFALLDRMEALR